MNTIQTIATAIAENTGQAVEYVAEHLTAGSSEVEFFSEMDTLASNAETSTSVLEAIESYCSEQLNEEFAVDAADTHLLIRAKAYGTRNLKNPGAFAVTIGAQVDELDWELPNLPEFEDASEYEDEILSAFEKHNDVALEGKARDYFVGAISDYYGVN